MHTGGTYMNKQSLYKKAYRAKNDYAPDEYNGTYIKWEDIIITTQKHPETGIHLTQAQIAKALARSLQSIEARKRYIKKLRGGFYRLELIDPKPEDKYAKEDKRYQNFIHGVDRYINVAQQEV